MEKYKKIDINLKYVLRHGMTDLNYVMQNILYEKFKITLNNI